MKLRESLKRLSARYRLRVFLRSLTAALAGTLAAAGLWLAVSALLGREAQFVPVTLGAAAAALLLAAVITVLVPTDAAAASRFVEAADPDLHARLSTGLELEKQDGTAGPVRQAQLADALHTAGKLKPEERIPLGPPRPLFAYLGSAAAVLAVALIIHQPGTTPAADPAAPERTAAEERLSSEEQAEVAENLRELAELFSGLDEEEEDPYLRAIARQLEELSERVAADGADREETAAELERLLQHTRTVQDIQETPEQKERLAELPEQLESALQDVLEPPEALAEGAADETDGDAEAAADAQAETAGDAAGPSLQDLLDPDGDDSSVATAAGEQGESGSYYEMSLDDDAIAELAERAMEQAESAPDGDIIGASDESGAGDSQLAGEGTQDLFGDEEGGALASEEIEQLDVPEETNPDGRRVRVEVAPEAELTEVRMTPLGRMTWNRMSEAPTQRERVSTGSRSLTARFHTPEQEY
ncbi:MAG TPA: hypothetical protein VK092_02460 [Deinococcales bacterium]|nr:hypothetical protein [Deinococcales bacterium]